MNEARITPGKLSTAVDLEGDGPAVRLWMLWTRGERPDVAAFVEQAGPLAPGVLTEVLRVDQRERWGAGERPAASRYLGDFPTLARDIELAMELIYGEFLIREQRGEAPTLEEYARDYPEYAERLKLQIELHQELGPVTLRDLDANGGRAAGAVDVPRPRVAGYEVLSELGRGGMGVVYKALHIKLNRVVALKMILAGDHASARELSRFQAEAEAAARLQHPNIVQIYEVGEQEGRPYLALEYVDGPTLARRIQGTPFQVRDAVRMARTLTLAVHEAHRRGVVHRDLKPENVLLAGGEVPKIADFGLAKFVEGAERSESAALMGTPAYMAPEQAMARGGAIGPATDVYALGAILYAMLTGHAPFGGAVVLDVLEQVRRQEPVPPGRLHPKLPRDVETICLKCLEKDPQRRYGGADELASDLDNFLEDRPIRARPVGFVERLWRLARRNPVPAALLTMVVAAVLSGITGVVWQWRRAESNLDAHREAIQQYFMDVSTNKLLNEAGSHKLRKELLEDALKYYERFVEERGQDVKARSDLARNYFHMASLVGQMGPDDEALTTYERALRIVESLARVDPSARREQAKLLNNIGNVLARMPDRREEAIRSHQRSIDLRRALVAEEPDNVGLQRELSRSYYNLGRPYRASGRLADALGAYQTSLEIEGRLEFKVDQESTRVAMGARYAALGLVQRDLGQREEALVSLRRALELRRLVYVRKPKILDYIADVAESEYNLGNLLQKRVEQREEALSHYREALSLRDRLADENPDMAEYQVARAMSLNVVGFLELDTERIDDAARSARRARDLWEQLARRSPATVKIQGGLAMTLNLSARVAKLQGRLDDALSDYRYGLEMRERLARQDRDSASVQGELAQSHHNIGTVLILMGRHAEARESLDEAIRIRRERAGTNADDHVSLAESLSRWAEAVDRVGDDAAGVERHVNDAIAALRRAVDLGSDDAEDLRTNEEFAFLSKDPRLEELLGARGGSGRVDE